MTKEIKRLRRAHRSHTKAKLSGRPRLLVYKSNTSMYASIIDDAAGKVVCSASSLKMKGNSVEMAKKVGEEIAKMAKKKKIETVSFDRNGFVYHGKISALADSARENGLIF